MADNRDLQAWVDKLEIRELIERAMRYIDNGDGERLVSLFDEDGMMQLSASVFDREGIRAMGRGSQPPWTAPGELLKQPGSAHLSSNPVIDVDGDAATAETDMVTLRRGEDGRAQIALIARYRDHLRRGDDGWRIRTRTGVSIARPGESGTDAEWSRALAKMDDETRAKFRME
jgi:hypothetical protein